MVRNAASQSVVNDFQYVVNDFQYKGVGTVSLRVFDDLEPLEQDWRALETNGICSVYQCFDWINGWNSHVAKPARIQTCIIVGSVDDTVLFILPLGLRTRGPFSIASWLGDSHTNFHMGLYSKEFLQRAAPEQFREMIMHILAALPKIDVMELCCQPVVWQDFTNPFSYLEWRESHNQGFMLKLDESFNATLDRKNGNRKRKKYRWQVNKLKSVGGAQLRIASTEEEVDRFIDTALDQLNRRFSLSGIWNRFEDDGVEKFFRKLAKQSLMQSEPEFQIFGLEIDGKLRAMFAGGVRQARFSGFFISTAKDEYAHISPGEMIIYLVIEECVKRGYKTFDLGRGEERYKTSWCDTVIPMFETNIALTNRGVFYAGYEWTKLSAKKLVRNNETLWELAKKVRSRLYGRL